ncbi:MAG: SDR family NAD(P)-dependent oxidoreductase [Bacteroidales bacterium]|jgi:short-subunit dehydrogenase|nr:SDR family NAD(P)-dependent oxidoreductase [Bacteroidales bacterium]MCB9028564.1 SDR family NAD(P)-dependent oxidoreductase [Bacteroidales bacterium]NLD62294.1 SDR family NAD(P)-dependent oxidoreductase [Bacteroidales bacterium]HNT93898.1 SDR family NAD(P)-dependent oxidoreductase [Bacteroidales bacterium]HPJ06037.1 SDR family NAD(P)-dependent oxidoreductase [Bacteroidales bacterium]
MINESSKKYAIVTGSSQGLGRALAEELAARGHNLLLAALPDTGLPQLSADLAERHSVSVHFIETDLMRMETPRELLDYISVNSLEPDILINNVGIGHGGEIGEYTDSEIEESVFLNIRCTSLMVNAFVGELKERGRAFILNIGSFGGFMPVPFKSIYTATKAYIYHFSLSIREELRGKGISVSVAMPGGIITNHRVRERLKKLGPFVRMNAMEPDRAARYIIDHMLRGRSVIIPGWTMRVGYFISSCLPYRLLMLLTGRMFRGIN